MQKQIRSRFGCWFRACLWFMDIRGRVVSGHCLIDGHCLVCLVLDKGECWFLGGNGRDFKWFYMFMDPGQWTCEQWDLKIYFWMYGCSGFLNSYFCNTCNSSIKICTNIRRSNEFRWERSYHRILNRWEKVRPSFDRGGNLFCTRWSRDPIFYFWIKKSREWFSSDLTE